MTHECNSEYSCGDNCQNRKIQKGLTLALEQFRTLENGYGLKTLQLISKNEFIIEYLGEVLTKEEYERRRINSLARFSLSFVSNAGIYMFTLFEDKIYTI